MEQTPNNKPRTREELEAEAITYWRKIYPMLDDKEILEIHHRLKRYVQIAIEIAKKDLSQNTPPEELP
jgi:hypothetical protein